MKHSHIRRRVAFALCMSFAAGAGLLGAREAKGRLSANTISPVAVLTNHGREIIVRGPMTGTEGERGFQQVSVTQRSSGAVAFGHAILTFTGSAQQWEIRTHTTSGADFVAGPATAVAICQTTNNGKPTDAHQWLVNVELVDEEGK